MNLRSLLLAPALLLTARAAIAQQKPDTDSITIAVHPQYKAGAFKRALLGKNYRKLWATPVKMKVFHLNREKGGLKIVDEGGGNQTNSLHLEDAQGNEWVLRSVQKTTSRELPQYYNHTIVTSFLQDEVSTAHPFSPLTVPPLAEAVGVPHSHPQLVYLADDASLGKYRKKYANQVYMFEEQKLPGKKEIKTEKLQDKLESDNDEKADQKQLLRARLLDMIIGDWDRHGDQWRWRKEQDTTKNLYEPVPRDRDKVYYTTDGLLPYFIALGSPKLQPFKKHIHNVSGWNSNAVNFDLYFLNQLNRADWEEQIKYVQGKLTDDLIKRSVKLMPANIYALSGPKIVSTVIARRNNIAKDAIDYYKFLSKTVDVPGSDKNERFSVSRLDNGRVNVTINKFKNDSVGKAIYQRTFEPTDTKEIHLFGLGGKNNFSVTGNQPSPIKVRLIGGTDVDTYNVAADVPDKNRVYVYDRSDQQNNLPQQPGVRLMTSTDTNVNKFERPEHKSNHFAPVVSLGYSPEDGVLLIGGVKLEKFGFKREPYVYKQDLRVSYTLAKGSFIITYKGDFKKVIGDNDLLINVMERGPKNVNNFFGLGNVGEFVNAGFKTFDYYRNLYDYTVADVRLAHQYGNWQISGGLIGQYYNSLGVNNTDHFFGEYNQLHPELRLFATKFYAGLVAGATYDRRDNTSFTTRGVMWKTTVTGLDGLNVPNHTNGSLLSTFNFYLPLKDSTIVLADRTGAGIFVGQGEFFQMMQLGGPSLQGYHTSRFIGNQVAYNNLELRAKLFNFHTYLMPGSLGLIGYNDFGRVWLDGETSHTWHEAYGAGFYITPYHAFVLQAVIGRGTEGWLTYYSIGFRF